MNFYNDNFIDIIQLFANFDRSTSLRKLPKDCIHFQKEVFKYGKYIIKKTNFEKNKNTDHYLFENEAFWLEKLQSYSFVPRFYGKYYFQNNIYLIMEYIQGISINNLDMISLRRLRPFIEHFTQKMNEALDVFQTEGITHKDLRPSNIIIDQSFRTCKIIDYQFCSEKGKQIVTHCKAQKTHYEKAIRNVGGAYRMPENHGHNYDTDRYAVEKILNELQTQIMAPDKFRYRLFYNLNKIFSSSINFKKIKLQTK